MCIINSKDIENAVCELCLRANLKLPEFAYNKILQCENENYLQMILKNAYLANINQRPLCQDTGQVIVFAKIGQCVQIKGENFSKSVNNGVKKAYIENFLRKSVVNNTIFDRSNTQNNTPAIIYTEIADGDCIELSLLVKGAGSENNSRTVMLNPNTEKSVLFDEIKNIVQNAVDNSCPPLFLGIGAGGTLDYCSVLAKKALVEKEFSKEDEDLASELKKYLNENIHSKLVSIPVLDVKIISTPTHIACFPVSVAINCHSIRHSSCLISGKTIEYEKNDYKIADVDIEFNYRKVNSDDILRIKNLKSGEKILLSGDIYTARDAAHKKITEMINNKKNLPFDIKDKIIFYAGPCPAKNGEVIGPVGPTTSYRMDKYAQLLFENGIVATIGKGERNKELVAFMQKNNFVHFSMVGGIASFYANCIKKSEIVAFDELGAEAVYKLTVENLPLEVSVGG